MLTIHGSVYVQITCVNVVYTDQAASISGRGLPAVMGQGFRVGLHWEGCVGQDPSGLRQDRARTRQVCVRTEPEPVRSAAGQSQGPSGLRQDRARILRTRRDCP